MYRDTTRTNGTTHVAANTHDQLIDIDLAFNLAFHDEPAGTLHVSVKLYPRASALGVHFP